MTCLRPRSSAEPSSSSSVAALREEPSRTVRSSSLTRHRNPVFIEHVCIEHRAQHKAGLLFLFSAEEARTRVGVGWGGSGYGWGFTQQKWQRWDARSILRVPDSPSSPASGLSDPFASHNAVFSWSPLRLSPGP